MTVAELSRPQPCDSFSLGECRVNVFAKADQIDPATWRAAFGHTHKDFEYYRLIEQTMTSGFEYRYLLLIEQSGAPLALQPLVIVDQDLAATAHSVIGSIVEWVRKPWPRFLRSRMLLAGCLVGESAPGVIAPATLSQVAPQIADALIEYARRNRIHLVSAKDFPAAQRDELSSLGQRGYTRLRSFPPLKIDLNFASFDQYLESRLSRITRKGLRRKFRQADAASPPIVLEVLSDCSAVIDEIYPLYLAVARRAPVEFEIFSREYFLEAGRRMEDRHRYFVWRRAGKAVAFSFCTVWNGAIYDNDIGLDYSVAHELNLYYVTFRDIISWALEHGLTEYHCAPFNYETKFHLRLEPIDVDLYVKHRSKAVNAFIRWFGPLFEPARSDEALRNYHAERNKQGPSSPVPKAGWLTNAWIQLAINVVIVTVSELLLKIGAQQTAHLSGLLGWSGITGLASAWTWLGIGCVILSLFSWLNILRLVPLSIAFPLSNATHILVPLSCWWLLGEGISPRRWLGIALVSIGLVVVAKPFARMEEKL